MNLFLILLEVKMVKKKRTKRKGITIQFIPYSEIAYLSSFRRVKKLVDLAVENKILLIQGKLAPEEEADLIEETMKHIGKSRSSRFRGIELATFSPKTKELPFFTSVREKIATSLFGERDIITIIGPATVVREIKNSSRY